MLIASCVGGKKKVNPFEKLTEEIDSVNIHHDSVAIDTLPPVEEIIPATADECFADFFYNLRPIRAFSVSESFLLFLLTRATR